MKTKKLDILIASDKFKGSLSAFEAIEAISLGILDTYPEANLSCQAMADGGDGSIDVLHQLWQLDKHWIEVKDPLQRSIQAMYYTKHDMAFIEMSKASGLAILKEEEKIH